MTFLHYYLITITYFSYKNDTKYKSLRLCSIVTCWVVIFKDKIELSSFHYRCDIVVGNVCNMKADSLSQCTFPHYKSTLPLDWATNNLSITFKYITLHLFQLVSDVMSDKQHHHKSHVSDKYIHLILYNRESSFDVIKIESLHSMVLNKILRFAEQDKKIKTQRLAVI